MRYIHIDLPVDAARIEAAWADVIAMNHRLSWAGIMARRSDYEMTGINSITSFNEREVRAFLQDRIFRTSQSSMLVQWVRMTFMAKNANEAMEIAIKHGTGNMKYGDSCQPDWN